MVAIVAQTFAIVQLVLVGAGPCSFLRLAVAQVAVDATAIAALVAVSLWSAVVAKARSLCKLLTGGPMSTSLRNHFA